jgi:uncharacterized protein (DUF58 family)
MLSPDLVKKIKKIHIKAGRRVNTLMAGQYKSVFRGTGIEFEEVREYFPGDEVKSIDWKVSARLGRPFVKRYREEREQVVMLLLDMSASGLFGTSDALKKETAAEAASILAFNAIRNNDKVGAILFTEQVEKYIPPKKGSAHVWRVIREMFSFRPVYAGTDLKAAVDYLGRVCRKRTTAFLISDFLLPMRRPAAPLDWGRSFRSTVRRHELIAVVVSDPGEFRLPETGLLLVEDAETGEVCHLDAADRRTRERFETLKRREYAEILEALKRARIDAVPLETVGDAADALTRYFRIRERRKR